MDDYWHDLKDNLLKKVPHYPDFMKREQELVKKTDVFRLESLKKLERLEEDEFDYSPPSSRDAARLMRKTVQYFA